MLLEPSCQVEEAETALEALSLLQRDCAFDLVLVDQRLPSVTGLELCDQLVSRHPRLQGRMVLMSGGGLERAQWQDAERAAVPVLEKPFDAEALWRVRS